MLNDNLELIKGILINWLNQQLLRKYAIDEEIKRLSREDDSKLDIEISRLEKAVGEKLGLLNKIIHYSERKKNIIRLSNLKIQKTLIYNLRSRKIEELLQERERLAYNEYTYTSRIDELSCITEIDKLSLTEEEKELLKKVLPFNVLGSTISVTGNKK